MGIVEPREREKQMRRQQILDAAKKMFSQKGFTGATIESIAKDAELSPATLYLYFKNKDELYASLNMKILEVLIEGLEKEASAHALRTIAEIFSNPGLQGFKRRDE